MKLLIDIPQTMIDELRDGCFGIKHNVYELAGLIMDGTVLEQEPKTGHWIEYNWSDSNGTCRWGIKCSQCNKKYKYGAEVWLSPNYCPNCGARMSEVEQ